MVMEIHSTHNEGKSVVAERFIRICKDKIYKYMNSLSKSVYNDKLDDIVNEYNNTYNRTIKINPVGVKSSTYIDFGVENNDKDPKFKVLLQIGQKKFLLLIKLKIQYHGHM